MVFRFVHSADWQIGKPFRNLPRETAGRLEGARLDAIDRLAEVAQEAGAAHVLVAGDVYDAEGLPQKLLRQPLERMSRHTGITWHLLPGNHDPARTGGLWSRLATIGLPGNVRAASEPVAHEMAANVFLLPAPLTSKSPGSDPTAHLDAIETPAGALRIGLAHGSIQDFGETGECAALIDPARARKAGLCYLALGDWHGVLKIDERTWYSGTPEPDRFRGNEPGFALCVTLDGAAPPQVQKVETAHFRWLGIEERIAHLDELSRIERRIERAGVAPSCVLADVALSGSLPLAARAGLEAWRGRLEGQIEHLQLDVARLAVAADAADLALFGEAGELRHAADYLKRLSEDTANERAETARAALIRLAEDVARVRGGAT